MKNYERAKNYQRKLYSALGREWDESFFNDYWEATIWGHEWDYLYDNGLLENDFCAWCGNDELKTYYYRAISFSQRNVKVFICDECFFKATGGIVPEHKREQNFSQSDCFIATSIYGSHTHPSVIILKKYRDDILIRNYIGKLIIKIYYFFGPILAKKISANIQTSNILKKYLLDPLVNIINKKYNST